MSWHSLLELALRLVGLMYVVGGFVVFRQARVLLALGESMHTLEAMLTGGEAVPHDAGRARWLLVGGLLTMLAGLVFLLFPVHGVWTQGVLVIHEFAYLARQWRRMRRAKGDAAAEDARPAGTVVNAAIGTLVVWVAAAWFTRSAG